MKLTVVEQQAMARKAQWYFDCYFGLNHDDSVVFTGDGVDDLDKLISRLEYAFTHNGTNVNSRFQCDVGTLYSVPKPFDVDDVKAVRTYYMEFYGTVNKPAVLTRSDAISGPVAISL